MHALKIGGSFQRWTVRRYQQLDASDFLQVVRSNPDAARDSLANLIGTTMYTNMNNFGFDVFGNETDEEGLLLPSIPFLVQLI